MGDVLMALLFSWTKISVEVLEMLIISFDNGISGMFLCDAWTFPNLCWLVIIITLGRKSFIGYLWLCERTGHVSCLPYSKMHLPPSLRHRSTKCVLQCANSAGGPPLSTTNFYCIPFFVFSSFPASSPCLPCLQVSHITDFPISPELPPIRC